MAAAVLTHLHSNLTSTGYTNVHMRALSFCSLELYVLDTVFQESMYRSIHMAIHFCEEEARTLMVLKQWFPSIHDDDGRDGAHLLRVVQRTSRFSYALLKAFVCHSLKHKDNAHLFLSVTKR